MSVASFNCLSIFLIFSWRVL